MRKLVPVRGSVVCKKTRGGTRTELRGGIAVAVSEVDIYQILSMSDDVAASGFPFGVGDMVMSNATGDEIEINPGETVYLFKADNIMCSVRNNG